MLANDPVYMHDPPERIITTRNQSYNQYSWQATPGYTKLTNYASLLRDNGIHAEWDSNRSSVDERPVLYLNNL